MSLLVGALASCRNVSFLQAFSFSFYSETQAHQHHTHLSPLLFRWHEDDTPPQCCFLALESHLKYSHHTLAFPFQTHLGKGDQYISWLAFPSVFLTLVSCAELLMGDFLCFPHHCYHNNYLLQLRPPFWVDEQPVDHPLPGWWVPMTVVVLMAVKKRRDCAALQHEIGHGASTAVLKP